jgi:hypothetical protein
MISRYNFLSGRGAAGVNFRTWVFGFGLSHPEITQYDPLAQTTWITVYIGPIFIVWRV